MEQMIGKWIGVSYKSLYYREVLVKGFTSNSMGEEAFYGVDRNGEEVIIIKEAVKKLRWL